MRSVPERRARVYPSHGRVITPGSPEWACCGLSQSTGAVSSGAWVSANDPIAFPFAISRTTIIKQLGTMNGSSAGGGFDIGVYDLAWARLVSTGSQTGTGNSVMQYIDVTDTTVGPGRYYAVMVRDNTTANRQSFIGTTASVPLMAFSGVLDSSTDAYPLPNPLTNMATAAAASRIPVIHIVCRS